MTFLAKLIAEAQEENRNPKEQVLGRKDDYEGLMMSDINWKKIYTNACSFFNNENKMKELLKEVIRDQNKIILTQDDLKQYIKFAQASVFSSNWHNYDTEYNDSFEQFYFDKNKKDDVICSCRSRYSDTFSKESSLALDYTLGIETPGVYYINQFTTSFETVKKVKMSANELSRYERESLKEGTTTFKTTSNFESKSRKYVAFPVIKHDSYVDYSGHRLDRVIFAVACCPKLNYFADFCEKEGLNVQWKDNETIEINR